MLKDAKILDIENIKIHFFGGMGMVIFRYFDLGLVLGLVIFWVFGFWLSFG